jgi:hypothetical protein
MINRSEHARVEEDEYITVVSGLPRSGTSMMMQILRAGGLPVATDGLRQADEDNPKGYFELEAVKQLRRSTTHTWLEELPGKAVKMVYRLLYFLPDCFRYRVIVMCRDVHEVVASQRAMLDRVGNEVKVNDEALASIFERDMQRLGDWLRQRPDIPTLFVNYNEVILRSRPGIEEVNRFLGGGLNIIRMMEAVDESLYRHRESRSLRG